MALLPKKTSAGWKGAVVKLVIDAYAWIEYLNGSEKGRKVAEIVENDSNEIFTSSCTIAEVVSKSLRENKDAKIALAHINNLSNIISVTQEISILTGQIHFEAKKKNKDFGMLDAFVAATARLANAKILTGDKHFKNFKEAVLI